jgi:hypothetical protein
MAIRLIRSGTSQAVAWPRKRSPAIVYRIVESRDPREGHVPVAGAITTFGRTYQVQPLPAVLQESAADPR